ncbi:MAG: PAS domain-containing protein [Planctomycetota bacterium]
MTREDDLTRFQTSATYRALANSLPLSLLIKSVDGGRVFANQAYLRWRKLSWEDVAGKTDHDLFPTEVADVFAADDQRVMSSGESFHNVEANPREDGSQGWIERIKSPIWDQHGRVLGVQVMFWDVTDRVNAEHRSQFEESLLKTLMENIPDSVYFKDLDSRFIRVSEAMARKFGLQGVDQVHGRTDADIFSPEHASDARRDEVQIMSSGEPLVDRVERETWRDRDDTWCLTTKMPLRDSDHQIIGTFGISRDITELKKSEAALREAVRRADAANRAKSEFLANMSHEIRTPINAMVGMSELLGQTELSEVQRDYVHVIQESSASLLRLINDILDFSKIEAQRLELESVAFSIRRVVDNAFASLRWKANEKALELNSRIDDAIPDRVIGDPGRLQQVLVNLAGNAIKFTDHGQVAIEIRSSRREEQTDSVTDQVDITFAVVDTGIGIPASQQDAILQPFTQADASTTRRFGGTGLGLSISRQLVELMGGELSLASQVGVGTTFQFDLRLPVAPPSLDVDLDDDPEEDLGAHRDVNSDRPARSLRVLVAEDGLTNQQVIAGLLRSLGHQCTLASDGRETVSRWKTGGFDLILMDMHMPVMDGLEATRAIRAEEDPTRPRIPIVALTAAATQEDATECRAAGMDDYLTKPVLRRHLQRALSKHIHSGTDPAGSDRGDDKTIPESAAPNPTQVDDSSTSWRLSPEHAACLDLDSARSRIPGGAAGVLRLAAVFQDECEQLVSAIHSHWTSRDWDSLARAAHTLKGASGLLGARQLQATTQQLESAASAHDEDAMNGAMPAFNYEAERVLAAVAALRSQHSS